MTTSRVDGVLLLNKPYGVSSNFVLQQVKVLYQAKKVGHTGTLDPLATGLLPICFGEATKFSSFALEGNKEYIATIKLGAISTTYDAEGEIVDSVSYDFIDIKNKLINCIQQFIGSTWQIPPIYSALKVNGKRLYEYARTKQEVPIKAREVNIFELQFLEFTEPDIVTLRILCSKGTYIRTLAHDIGQKLGCGAYLKHLIRTKTNDLLLDDSVTIDILNTSSIQIRYNKLLPIDTLVNKLKCLDLNAEQFNEISKGHKFYLTKLIPPQELRLYYNSVFLGIAKIIGEFVIPIRLCSDSWIKRLT